MNTYPKISIFEVKACHSIFTTIFTFILQLYVSNYQLVSNLASKFTGSMIFTACIVCVYNSMFKFIDRLLTFSHIVFYWKNIWGPLGDHVKMVFASSSVLTTFLLWVCVLHMLFGLLPIFSYFGDATYTRVRPIHRCY